jgi:Rod binding domain-containing protein
MNSVSNSLISSSLVSPGNLGPSSLGAGLSLSSPDLALQLEELGSATANRAETVGQEFESIFVSLLLKEMRNSLDTGEGGLFGSEQSDTFGGMFDQFMGQHLAEASPLGIADAIKSYLKNAAL